MTPVPMHPQHCRRSSGRSADDDAAAVPSTRKPPLSSTTTPTPASAPRRPDPPPVPGPAAPSARPGGDGATAAESAAATTFARLVRQHCDLACVPNPAQVRASDLGDGVFRSSTPTRPSCRSTSAREHRDGCRQPRRLGVWRLFRRPPALFGG